MWAQTKGAQDGAACSSSDAGAPLLHKETVEQSLEDGLTEVRDFQGLLATRPKQVIKWLQENGMEKLGEFEVQDSLFYAAASDETGLVTAGAQERHLPDYERFWREYLASRSSRSRRMSPAWSETVRVEAWVVALRNAAAPNSVGVVHPLLRRFQGGAASMIVFGLPAVLATVDFKFEHWGQRLLYAQLVLYNIWLFAFTIFTIIFQDEDVHASLADIALVPAGQATIALEVIAMAAMLPFLYIEVASAAEYGRSWFDIQNLIDACTYINQVVITVLHLGRIHLDGDLILVLMALQCILLWLRLQFYLKVFRASKFAFVDTLVVVLKDVKWFLVFLIFTMWGFACAFHVLFRTEQNKFEEYSTLWRSLYTMFAAAVGEFDSKTYLAHHNPGMTLPLFVVYLFIVAIILLNLLVALLTNSFQKMTEHAGLRAVISKAQIIDELEDGLPSWAKRLGGTAWYPSYVHVLKVSSSQKEELSSAALWTGREDLLDSAEEARMRTRALEAKVDALIAAVDQLLQAGGGSGGGGGRPPAMQQKLKEAARDDEAATRGVEVSLQQASKGEGPGEAIGGESMQEQDDPHEPVTIKES